jgi:hypothetical protein
MTTTTLPNPEHSARRIVLTGGSSGIGQAIARRLSGPSTTIANLMATGLGYFGGNRDRLVQSAPVTSSK